MTPRPIGKNRVLDLDRRRRTQLYARLVKMSSLKLWHEIDDWIRAPASRKVRGIAGMVNRAVWRVALNRRTP